MLTFPPLERHRLITLEVTGPTPVRLVSARHESPVFMEWSLGRLVMTLWVVAGSRETVRALRISIGRRNAVHRLRRLRQRAEFLEKALARRASVVRRERWPPLILPLPSYRGVALSLRRRWPCHEFVLNVPALLDTEVGLWYALVIGVAGKRKVGDVVSHDEV